MANKKIPAKLTMRQAFKAAQGPLDLEDEEAEIKDNWYSEDDEDFDADLEAQSYEVFGLNKI